MRRVGGAAPNPSGDGSCMIVVATDAPLDARNLERLAKRALLGIARTGGYFSNGSGDYAIAFSTAAGVRVPHRSTAPTRTVTVLRDDAVSPLFQAAAEAAEEAILNSLFKAVRTEGKDGHVAEALPLDARQGPAQMSREEAQDDRRPRRHGPRGRGLFLREDRPRDRGRARPGPPPGRSLQSAADPGQDARPSCTAARARSRPSCEDSGRSRRPARISPSCPASRPIISIPGSLRARPSPYQPDRRHPGGHREDAARPENDRSHRHDRDRAVGDRRPALRGRPASRSSSPPPGTRRGS